MMLFLFRQRSLFLNSGLKYHDAPLMGFAVPLQTSLACSIQIEPLGKSPSCSLTTYLTYQSASSARLGKTRSES